MRRSAWIVALVLVLALPTVALSVTLDEVEREVKCPTCSTPLSTSDAPVADDMRLFIRERIAAGDSKQEIIDLLVDEFGPTILATPPKRGFDLVAWVVPTLAVLLGAIAILVLSVVWRRRATFEPDAAQPEPSAEDLAALERELRHHGDL